MSRKKLGRFQKLLLTPVLKVYPIVLVQEPYIVSVFLTYSKFKKITFKSHEKSTRFSCLTVQILTLSPSFFLVAKAKKESPVIFGSSKSDYVVVK